MKAAVCIASGPSLTIEDINLCMSTGRTVYAVSNVYTIAPDADVLYAADGDWWDLHEGVRSFKGERWCTDPLTCERWGLQHMPGTSSKVFAVEPPMAYGGHSGFQAINLAYLQGHRDIWLLGYDMGYEGKKHFFGEHPQKINRTSNYNAWLKHFKKAKPLMDSAGLTITNMTRQTVLTVFDRGDLCAFK